MHVAWTIERFLNGALVVGVGALLSLQLLARPRHAAQVAPLKVLFHRLGLLSVALKVPHSIDPGGVAGVISDPIITIFDTNALALLVGFATAFAYFMVSAVFGTKLAPPPAGLRAGLIAINLITLASVDVLLVLWAAMDREFYRGVQYLVWAFYITVVSSVLFFAAFKLHSSMRTLFKTSAPVDRDGSGDQRSEMLRKLMFFQVVGAVAAIGCVYQLVARGISRARDPHAAIQIESSDKYPPFSIVALYGYWFFMLLFTWWTYTDITVLWRSSEAPASQHLVPLLSGADEEGPVRMQHRSLRASSAASIVDDRETGGVEDYKRFEERRMEASLDELQRQVRQDKALKDSGAWAEAKANHEAAMRNLAAMLSAARRRERSALLLLAFAECRRVLRWHAHVYSAALAPGDAAFMRHLEHLQLSAEELQHD